MLHRLCEPPSIPLSFRYLIPFAPLAFASQRQVGPRGPLSPRAFLPISTHFTAPPAVPAPPTPLQAPRIRARSPVEPGDFSGGRRDPPTRALSPVIPNNVRTVRLTAAAGTNLARASSRDRSRDALRAPFLPLDRGLQPEGLRPPRGVARSGLRPLPKILDCSLP